MLNKRLNSLISILLVIALVWTSGQGAEAALIIKAPETIPGISYINFLHNEEHMRLETQAMSLRVVDCGVPKGDNPIPFPFMKGLLKRFLTRYQGSPELSDIEPPQLPKTSLSQRWFTWVQRPIIPRFPEITWALLGAAVSAVLLTALQQRLFAVPGVSLACGIYGLMWFLDPAKNRWDQLIQIGDYYYLVMEAVASRGPQAVGVVLFMVNRKGDVVQKRFRLVNEKRVVLSKVMMMILNVYVTYLYAVGYKFLPYVEAYSHVRYATQGTRTHKNTHPLLFQPRVKEAAWKFEGPGVIKSVEVRPATIVTITQKEVEPATLVGKNGDLDWFWLYGRWVAQKDVKAWLIKVLNISADEAAILLDVSVDSITVAGLMNLFIAQGRWVPATRLAYALYVATDIADTFPTDKELEQMAAPFDAIFAQFMAQIKSRNLSAYSQFTKEDEETLITRALAQSIPGIPDAKKEAYVRAAVQGFLHMNPKMAMTLYLRRTMGHPDNSASCKVVNTLYPNEVVIGAHKQPAAVAFDPVKKRMAYASLEMALAGRIKGEGTTLPWIMNLRDAEGEVLKMTPTSMSLFNMRENHEYTLEELLALHRIVPNNETNPYWSELPPAPTVGTRVEQSVARISGALAKLRDDHNNPQSWNSQTTDNFWDKVFALGLYKDILTKSRVNRIEDYESLADAIHRKAADILEGRKNNSLSEADSVAEIPRYGEFVNDCVQAFDFMKIQLRIVIGDALAHPDSSAGREEWVVQAQAQLRARLRARIADEALIDEIAQTMAPILSQALQDPPSPRMSRRVEDLALQVLDEVYPDPSRVHGAYQRGYRAALRQVLVDFKKLPGKLGLDHQSVVEYADRIADLFKPKFDHELNKTTDRHDPDIIIIGHSELLWQAEHFGLQIHRVMPAAKVLVTTGNKMLASLDHPESIEQRRHEFRMQLSGSKGYVRFGKRALVILIDQNGQSYMVKGSASPLRDLFLKYNMAGNIFTEAGRFFTPLLTATGGVAHPDVPFNKQSWSTLTGWVPEEPKSIVPATANFQLSGRILPRGLVYLRQLFPTYPVLECKVPAARAQALWNRGSTSFVDQEVPEITGHDIQGKVVPTALNYKIGTIARRWANYVIEAALTDHLTWVAITLVAFANWTPAWFFTHAGIWTMVSWNWIAIHAAHMLGSNPAPWLTNAPPQWMSFLQSELLGKFGNWFYFLPFMRWGWPLLIRLWQGRRLGDRRGKRGIELAMVSHVRQTLEMYVRGLFSHQTYASQGVFVEGGNAADHFLLRLARVLVPGSLVVLQVPDGGRSGPTAGKSSAGMVGSQAKGVVSWGRGPEVVAVGERVEIGPLSMDDSVAFGHPGHAEDTPENDVIARMENSIYGDLKLMIFGFVLFTKMAVRVSRFIPWMQWPLDSTLIGQDPTTRAPFGAPVSDVAAAHVDERLPEPSSTEPISLLALGGYAPIAAPGSPEETAQASPRSRRLTSSELRSRVRQARGQGNPPETTLLIKQMGQTPPVAEWQDIYLNTDATLSERPAEMTTHQYEFLQEVTRGFLDTLPSDIYVIKVDNIDNRPAYFQSQKGEGFDGVLHLDAALVELAMEKWRAGDHAFLEILRLQYLQELNHIVADAEPQKRTREQLEVELLGIEIMEFLHLDSLLRQQIIDLLKKHPYFDRGFAYWKVYQEAHEKDQLWQTKIPDMDKRYSEIIKAMEKPIFNYVRGTLEHSELQEPTIIPYDEPSAFAARLSPAPAPSFAAPSAFPTTVPARRSLPASLLWISTLLTGAGLVLWLFSGYLDYLPSLAVGTPFVISAVAAGLIGLLLRARSSPKRVWISATTIVFLVGLGIYDRDNLRSLIMDRAASGEQQSLPETNDSIGDLPQNDAPSTPPQIAPAPQPEASQASTPVEGGPAARVPPAPARKPAPLAAKRTPENSPIKPVNPADINKVFTTVSGLRPVQSLRLFDSLALSAGTPDVKQAVDHYHVVYRALTEILDVVGKVQSQPGKGISSRDLGRLQAALREISRSRPWGVSKTILISAYPDDLAISNLFGEQDLQGVRETLIHLLPMLALSMPHNPGASLFGFFPAALIWAGRRPKNWTAPGVRRGLLAAA